MAAAVQCELLWLTGIRITSFENKSNLQRQGISIPLCRGIGVECYLLGPFGQPALLVTLPNQLRPEERAEIVNIQQGFLFDSFSPALALYTVDKAIDVSKGGR